MSLATGHRSSSRFIKIFAFCICAVSLILASRGLFRGYSYWADELYSISASLDSWRSLIKGWILEDVHPPLYQVVLKLWMSSFGSSEIATRLLSFGFSFITLLALSVDAIAGLKWRRILALALVGVSPSFAYYSQETRSYSLVLALSTIATLAGLELRSSADSHETVGIKSQRVLSLIYYVGCILLSLTHFFGWLYVFALSVITFFERRIEAARFRSILLILVISIWPALHVVVGTLANRTGGNFWIKVSPPVLGTINIYLKGCLPFMAYTGSPYLFVGSWAMVAVFIAVVTGSWKEIRSFLVQSGRSMEVLWLISQRFLLLSLALVLGLMSVIDQHTPMSTSRNYIVLLPQQCFCFQMPTNLARSKRFRKLSGSAALLLAGIAIGLLVRQSWIDLSSKLGPIQNWKQLAVYVRESGVCSGGCFVMGTHNLHNYYFKDIPMLYPLALQKGAMGNSRTRASLENQINYLNSLPAAKVLAFHFQMKSDLAPFFFDPVTERSIYYISKSLPLRINIGSCYIIQFYTLFSVSFSLLKQRRYLCTYQKYDYLKSAKPCCRSRR